MPPNPKKDPPVSGQQGPQKASVGPHLGREKRTQCVVISEQEEKLCKKNTGTLRIRENCQEMGSQGRKKMRERGQVRLLQEFDCTGGGAGGIETQRHGGGSHSR